MSRGGFGKGVLARLFSAVGIVLLVATPIALTLARGEFGTGGGILAVLLIGYAIGALIGGGSALIRGGIGYLEGLSRSRVQRRSQGIRDELAEQILQSAVQGTKLPAASVGPFVLYLRPFLLTGKLPVSVASRQWNPLDNSENRVMDLETMVAEAMQEFGPVVALGEPGENIGFGRIKVPESKWRDVFEELASRATRILVVPADRPGTLWEIGRLLDIGRLATCVFLMPPDVEGLNLSTEWTQTMAALKPLGLDLPPFDPSGLLFRLSPDGKLEDSWPLFHGKRIDTRKMTEAREALTA